MANALEYILWRGDISFSASPVNEVDIFLFSQLSTPDYKGIVPGTVASESIRAAADKYFASHDESVKNLGALQSESVLPMLRMLPETARFGALRLAGFQNRVIEEKEEQFCAVTILLPDGQICVSFRGTDDSIIGWKEDFHLAVKESVPAQLDALEYLCWAADAFPGKIIVCGHSKGGNLAVYAAVHAPIEVQKRIEQVISFDGPGFRPGFIASEAYRAVSEKIRTVLSQNALVGTLLNRAGEAVIVKSSVLGPMAHDGFSWEVLGCKFVRCTELSEPSQVFDRAISATLEEMSDEEKDAFVTELFDILLSTGADTVSQLTDLRLSQTYEVARTLHKDEKVHHFTLHFLEQMIKSIRRPQIEIPNFSHKIAEITKGRKHLPQNQKET